MFSAAFTPTTNLEGTIKFMPNLGDTTFQNRADQQRQIRELMLRVQKAVAQGQIRFNPELDRRIREQRQAAERER